MRERLLKVTGVIANAATSAEVHEAMVQEIGRVLGASSGALWVLGDDAHAHLISAFGYNEERRQAVGRVPLEGGIRLPVLDCMRRGEAVWIPSQAALLAGYPQLASLVSADRAYAIACLPILVQGRVAAAVGFTFEGQQPIEDADRGFLLLVARYCGQALERVRARQRAELLYGLARSVIRAERIEDVFDAALNAIEAALDTRRASILTFDADGVMRFKAWRGLSEDYRRTVEGHSPWTRDAVDPQPIVVPDAGAAPDLEAFRPLFERERIGALAFIPLVTSGQLLGKFMVYYERPHHLADAELDLARAIADHVASAVSRFGAVAELRETVHFNEMFVGILSHDLRNPLGAIMTAAQLAMIRASGEPVAKPLSRIMTSGLRMTRMIEQLLDFTRVRVGTGVPLQLAATDLVPLLRQVMDELDDANPEWSLRLRHEGDTRGQWDADRLLQVFSNLVANAIQHGDVGRGVDVMIAPTSDDLVTVSVHNGGVIPADVLPRVFEPLAGGARRLDRSRGLGLGLYISREIVRAHRGGLAVVSDEATGTTFTVTLPRAPRR